MAEIFLTVEVYYNQGTELKREVLRNITTKKLKEFRETFFTVGLAVHDPNDKRHWVIVSPFNIVTIDVWKQDKFFRDGNDETKKSNLSTS